MNSGSCSQISSSCNSSIHPSSLLGLGSKPPPLFRITCFGLWNQAQQAIFKFQKLSLLKRGKGQNLYSENQFYLHEKNNSFSYQQLCTQPYFVCLFVFKERPGRAKETVPFTKADRLGAGKNQKFGAMQDISLSDSMSMCSRTYSQLALCSRVQ